MAHLRSQLGLDKSAFQQYFSWLRGIATDGWGWSAFHHRHASDVLADLLPASLTRIAAALAIGAGWGWLMAMAAFSGRQAFIIIGTAFLALPVFSPAALALWLMSSGAGLTPMTAPMWFEVVTVLIASLPVGLLVAMTVGSRLHGARQASLTAQYLCYSRASVAFSCRVLMREALPAAASAFSNSVIPALSAVTICEVVFSLKGFGAAFVKASQVADVPLMIASLAVVLVMFAAIQFANERVSAQLLRRSSRVSN